MIFILELFNGVQERKYQSLSHHLISVNVIQVSCHILPYNNNELVPGEYYVNEYKIPIGNDDIKIEVGFYSRRMMRTLIEKFNMPKIQIKWYIPTRKTLRCDTFKNYLLAIFSLFPESEAKLLANSFIGNLGKKYSRKDSGFVDSGFVCQSLESRGRF